MTTLLSWMIWCVLRIPRLVVYIHMEAVISNTAILLCICCACSSDRWWSINVETCSYKKIIIIHGHLTCHLLVAAPQGHLHFALHLLICHQSSHLSDQWFPCPPHFLASFTFPFINSFFYTIFALSLRCRNTRVFSFVWISLWFGLCSRHDFCTFYVISVWYFEHYLVDPHFHGIHLITRVLPRHYDSEASVKRV